MSVRMFVLGALTAVAALPAGAGAQERQPVPRPKVYFDDQEPQVIRDRIRAITQRRARLGVTVALRASGADSIGATIEAVTPGGPAAKAGIQSGDVITKINGKSLTAGSIARAGEEESLPGLRLVEYAAQLKPAETITLEYLRDGARKTVSLVTGNEVIVMNGFAYGDGGDFTWRFPQGASLERPFGEGGAFKIAPGDGGAFAFAFGGPLMNLELAPLNADLGAYFGTTEGVLVINVPKDSPLGVRGGDVILSVDGRKATGPNSFLRILRSYDPGDTFKLEIMRNKARTTVTGQLEKARVREQ
jgi:S1-C subfamily serine protease